MNYSSLFTYPGQPADPTRIAHIEQALGKTLPDDYKHLLAQTGGGSLNLKNSFLDGITLASGAELEISVETIFGNGKTTNDSNVDLVEYVMFLMEEWDIPDEVLLLADTEDGMHQCFVINYGLTNFPAGSVLHFDTDPDGEVTQVADSVDDFLAKLGPDPSLTEDVDDEADQDGMGIKGIRYGVLSETLQHAISVTPTLDVEQLLRKAAEPHANNMGGAILGNTKEGRSFFDVLYWITQHVQPQPDPETYINRNWNNQLIFVGNLLSGSFRMPNQKYGFIYTPGAVKMWWETRVQEGVLIPTEGGFVLDEDYINNVLSNLRSEL